MIDSSKKVSATAGWVFFIVGVVMATFAGGAVRAFLSPSQLAQWVESQLDKENPKFYLNFDQIEFALADGSMPRFGIRLHGLQVSAKNECESRSQFEVDKVYVPIKFGSLFKKRIQFSDIYISQLVFDYLPTVCNAQTEVPELLAGEDYSEPPPLPSEEPEKEVVAENPLKEVTQFFKTRFTTELQNSRYWFSSIEVDRVLVRKEEKKEWFAVNDFHVDLYDAESDQLIISADVEYLDLGEFKGTLEPFEVKLDLRPHILHARISARVKEGELVSDLHFKVEKEEYDFKAVAKYLPLGEVLKSIKKDNIVSKQIKPRLLWFSCEVRALGSVPDKTELKLKAKNCDLYGEAGRVQAKELTLMPFAEKKLEPFKVTVKKFSLQYFLGVFGNEILKSTLTDYGSLTGNLQVNSHEEFLFDGEITGVEALFSNGGQKRIQIIPKIEGEAQLKEGRLSGQFNNIDIKGGEYDGKITFNLDKHMQEGVVVVTIDKLKFSPVIENLILSGESEAMQLYGQMQLSEGKFFQWRGNFGWPKIRGKNWSAEGVKVESSFVDHIFEASINLDKLELEDGPAHELVAPIYLSKSVDSIIVLEELFLKSKLDAENGSWSKLKALDKKNGLLLASGGKWTSNKKVQGWINVDFPEHKLLTWTMEGTYPGLRIVPSVRLLKILAGKNSVIKVNENTPSDRRLDHLERLISKSQSGVLEKMRKAMLDSARKWLSFDKEETEDGNKASQE